MSNEEWTWQFRTPAKRTYDSLKRTPMILKREYAEPSAAKPPGWPEGVGTQPEELE